MCGPIALAIPLKRESIFSMLSGILTYNFGRILSYSVLGFVFGIVGKGILLAGWQNGLSIILGIGILLFLFVPKINKIPFFITPITRIFEKMKSRIRTLFGRHSYRSLLLIGIFNGLLPCGFVYLGIAGAIATSDVLKSTIFMIGFGLGTLPAMLTVTVIKDFLNLKFRRRIQTVLPVFVAAMGVLLILRGMNLDIPYVSPSVKGEGKNEHYECCHKK
jgi:sulfite exporter TauE/SafE